LAWRRHVKPDHSKSAVKSSPVLLSHEGQESRPADHGIRVQQGVAASPRCVPPRSEAARLSPHRDAMRIHFINPSDLSFGIGVITPSWLSIGLNCVSLSVP